MKQEWKSVGNFGTLGLEIVLSILLGLFVGRWLDGKLGISPWMTLLWSAFGVGAAVKAILRSVRDMRAETEREEREQGNPLPRYGSPSPSDVDPIRGESASHASNDLDSPSPPDPERGTGQESEGAKR
ncbi:AtpZ/AtpI family protein [Chondromyces crocatus]|uniref:AtpZ/AtpI family protein n=1 Tax=Chondromyces crocatus TaxID=52 RepID=UPI0009EB5613|nr:AtpZ/AtpI family protein [Chondromyces crocatus]